jgi:hypothetical protein
MDISPLVPNVCPEPFVPTDCSACLAINKDLQVRISQVDTVPGQSISCRVQDLLVLFIKGQMGCKKIWLHNIYYVAKPLATQ